MHSYARKARSPQFCATSFLRALVCALIAFLFLLPPMLSVPIPLIDPRSGKAQVSSAQVSYLSNRFKLWNDAIEGVWENLRRKTASRERDKSADPKHNPVIPHTLVLKRGLVI
jgi:hypothetical protein